MLLVHAAHETRPAPGRACCANGTVSGATTCDLQVARAQRRRHLHADEAGAHDDRALGAAWRAAMMARLSASVRSVWTCGWSAPGSGGRTGSAPVASSSASQATSRPSASVSLLGRPDRWPPPARRAPARSSARRRTRAGAAGSTLRARCRPGSPWTGSGDRRAAIVGAEQQDLAVVALAAQRLGRRFAGRARADDGDGPQRRLAPQASPARRAARRTRIGRAGALDVVAGEGVQRRRAQRRAGAQIEAGVVPGAADGVAVERALGQRAAVVGAGRADGEDLLAAGAPAARPRRWRGRAAVSRRRASASGMPAARSGPRAWLSPPMRRW